MRGARLHPEVLSETPHKKPWKENPPPITLEKLKRSKTHANTWARRRAIFKLRNSATGRIAGSGNPPKLSASSPCALKLPGTTQRAPWPVRSNGPGRGFRPCHCKGKRRYGRASAFAGPGSIQHEQNHRGRIHAAMATGGGSRCQDPNRRQGVRPGRLGRTQRRRCC